MAFRSKQSSKMSLGRAWKGAPWRAWKGVSFETVVKKSKPLEGLETVVKQEPAEGLESCFVRNCRPKKKPWEGPEGRFVEGLEGRFVPN